MLDAGLMAALAALRDAKVPHVIVDDRGKITYGGRKTDESSNNTAVEGKIEVAAAPVAVTTALYRKHLIVDPDAEEEQLADATVTVMMDGATVVGVHKPGGTAEASETDLMHCVAACRLNLEARAKAIDAAFA